MWDRLLPPDDHHLGTQEDLSEERVLLRQPRQHRLMRVHDQIQVPPDRFASTHQQLVDLERAQVAYNEEVEIATWSSRLAATDP